MGAGKSGDGGECMRDVQCEEVWSCSVDPGAAIGGVVMGVVATLGGRG